MAAKVETLRQPSSGATMNSELSAAFTQQQQAQNFLSLLPTTTTTTTTAAATVTSTGTVVQTAAVSSASESTSATAVSRPAKMKFSAIWDVDKTPTNCVPRLCRLNVTRLEVKPSALLPDLPSAVLLAVKIQGRRRTLRSTEIALQSNCNLVDLNMEFSLTYPHFLKRSNHIEIMLQRKKHYKNRTIPGYRTLAIARLDMNEVLQRPLDDALQDGQSMLELCAPVGNGSSDQGPSSSDQKASSLMTPVASLRLTSASEPVRVPTLATKSDDDISSGADDGNVVATDSDDALDEEGGRHRGANRSEKSSKKNLKSMALGQQAKFKQKIVSLLKKMKVSAASTAREAAGGLVSPTAPKPSDYYLEEDYDRQATSKSRKKSRRNSFPPHAATSSQAQQIEQSLEDLEAEIENWAPQSDEDSEGDGVSLAVAVQPTEATPKPSLRPFFFSDLRLSSEQLPLLIDERPHQSKKQQEASSSNTNEPSGLAHSPTPPNSGNALLHSPSKQTMPLPSLSSGAESSQTNSALEKPVSSSKTIQQQQQQTVQLGPMNKSMELPHHLALSPGIQLEHIFQTSTDMPGHVILVFDQSLATLARACSSLPDGLNVVCASNLGDVDVFFAEITRLLQKFSSKSSSTSYSSLLTTAPSPCQLKLVICGASDAFFAAVTHSFVERFSSRLPDAASLVRLLPVPLLHGSAVAQLLGAVSYNYRAFVETVQHDSGGNPSLLLQLLQDVLLLPGSLKRQLDLFSIPIGEVLLTIRDKSSDSRGGSRQVVLPFICDVQVNIVRSSNTTTTTTSNLLVSNAPQIVQQQQNTPTAVVVEASISSATAASSSFASSAAGPNSWVVESSQANSNDLANAPTNSNAVEPVNGGAGAVSSGSPPNTNAVTTTSAWGASSTPVVARVFDRLCSPGPHTTALSTTSQGGGASSSIVVPSPDAQSQNNSSTSAAFDVNIDYWLEANSVTSGGAMSSISSGMGGPSSAAGTSSSSILTSATSISSQLASVSGSLQTQQTVGSVSGSQNVATGPRTFNLRGSYRQMVVTRSLVHNSESPTPVLQPSAMTMIMSARDKKIKKIWLTRKSRDSIGGSSTAGGDKDASKGQTVVDGVNRLVCTVKSSSSGHKVIVCVDGVEFTGVKFFQISPVWHSHVKSFPVFTPSSFST